jgi:hypothetical protein
MTTFKAVIATDKPSRTGDILSKEALQKMAFDVVGLPFIQHSVTGDQIIGTVENSFLTDKGLEISVSIDIDSIRDRLYIIPSGFFVNSHMEGEIKVIDEVALSSVSLSTSPADTNLTPIRKDRTE